MLNSVMVSMLMPPSRVVCGSPAVYRPVEHAGFLSSTMNL